MADRFEIIEQLHAGQAEFPRDRTRIDPPTGIGKRADAMLYRTGCRDDQPIGLLPVMKDVR